MKTGAELGELPSLYRAGKETGIDATLPLPLDSGLRPWPPKCQ